MYYHIVAEIDEAIKYLCIEELPLSVQHVIKQVNIYNNEHNVIKPLS